MSNADSGIVSIHLTDDEYREAIMETQFENYQTYRGELSAIQKWLQHFVTQGSRDAANYILSEILSFMRGETTLKEAGVPITHPMDLPTYMKSFDLLPPEAKLTIRRMFIRGDFKRQCDNTFQRMTGEDDDPLQETIRDLMVKWNSELQRYRQRQEEIFQSIYNSQNDEEIASEKILRPLFLTLRGDNKVDAMYTDMDHKIMVVLHRVWNARHGIPSPPPSLDPA